MPRTYGLRLVIKSALLVAAGVALVVLTDNLWLGIGAAAVGVAALAIALKYRSREDQL